MPKTLPSLRNAETHADLFLNLHKEIDSTLNKDIEVSGFFTFLEDDSPFWTRFST